MKSKNKSCFSVSMAIQLWAGITTCILILFDIKDAKQWEDFRVASIKVSKDVESILVNKFIYKKMNRELTRSDNEGDETTSTEHSMLRPLICTFVPSIPECFFYSTMKPPIAPKKFEPQESANSSSIAYYEEIEPDDKPKKIEEGKDIHRLKHVIKMLCKTVLNILRT